MFRSPTHPCRAPMASLTVCDICSQVDLNHDKLSLTQGILQQLLADGANPLPSCPALSSLKALSVFWGRSGPPLLWLGFLWLREQGCSLAAGLGCLLLPSARSGARVR